MRNPTLKARNAVQARNLLCGRRRAHSVNGWPRKTGNGSSKTISMGRSRETLLRGTPSDFPASRPSSVTPEPASTRAGRRDKGVRKLTRTRRPTRSRGRRPTRADCCCGLDRRPYRSRHRSTYRRVRRRGAASRFRRGQRRHDGRPRRGRPRARGFASSAGTVDEPGRRRVAVRRERSAFSGGAVATPPCRA
jgi:hypothetical protein